MWDSHPEHQPRNSAGKWQRDSTSTFTASSRATTGTSTVTVTGTSGSTTHTTTIALTLTAQSTQLIQKGGFETGTLANWTPGGVYLPFTTTVQKRSGAYSAQLGASLGNEPKRRFVSVPGDHHSQYCHQGDSHLLVLALDDGHDHQRLAGGAGSEQLRHHAGTDHEGRVKHSSMDTG